MSGRRRRCAGGPEHACVGAYAMVTPLRAPRRGTRLSSGGRLADLPGSGRRSRPSWPFPIASPPCGRGARMDAGHLAALSIIELAPLDGALPDPAPGPLALTLARAGQPGCAVGRLRHRFRGLGPASDGLGAADLRTTVLPVTSDPMLRVRRGSRSGWARARPRTVTLRLPAVKEARDERRRGQGHAVPPRAVQAAPRARRRRGIVSSALAADGVGSGPLPRRHPSHARSSIGEDSAVVPSGGSPDRERRRRGLLDRNAPRREGRAASHFLTRPSRRREAVSGRSSEQRPRRHPPRHSPWLRPGPGHSPPGCAGAGGFPLRRATPDVWAVPTALDLLTRGECLLVFPEGGVNRGGHLRPGFSGAGYLALRPGVTVIPAVIWNTQLMRGPARVRFGPAIAMDDLRDSPRPGRNRRATERLMEVLAGMVPLVGGQRSRRRPGRRGSRPPAGGVRSGADMER
jgi:hypothetical protein